METKINYGRLFTGGIVAGLVLFIVGFVFHGVILKDNYMALQEMGSVLPEPRPNGMLIHIISTFISGICLAALYVMARNFSKPGPLTAVRVGFLVGLFTLGGMSAEYAFYNLGGIVPLLTFFDNLTGCILATLAAGALYKD